MVHDLEFTKPCWSATSSLLHLNQFWGGEGGEGGGGEAPLAPPLNTPMHTHNITVEHVTNAITHLTSEKNDNFEGLSSDNFKNGTHLLNVYISLLFSTMLSHGKAPAGLLLLTLVPLIKNSVETNVIPITTGLSPLAVL